MFVHPARPVCVRRSTCCDIRPPVVIRSKASKTGDHGKGSCGRFDFEWAQRSRRLCKRERKPVKIVVAVYLTMSRRLCRRDRTRLKVMGSLWLSFLYTPVHKNHIHCSAALRSQKVTKNAMETVASELERVNTAWRQRRPIENREGWTEDCPERELDGPSFGHSILPKFWSLICARKTARKQEPPREHR